MVRRRASYGDRAETYCQAVEARSLIDDSVVTSAAVCIEDADIEEIEAPEPPSGSGMGGGCAATEAAGRDTAALHILALVVLVLRRRRCA